MRGKKVINWFHRLLNPHCLHCIEAARESRICNSCEILKTQLEITAYEKKQLLRTIEIINTPAVAEVVVQQEERTEAVMPRQVPWHIRREMLEKQDRVAAALIKNKKRTTEELEEDLGINSSSSTG